MGTGQKRQQITFHARGRRRKKKWNEPAWHPKLIVPLSPPVLFFLNPARTFWEGIIFGSSVVELTLGIIFCLGPFWQRPKRANRIVVMTFTSPFKLVGKKTNGQMWVILDQTEGSPSASWSCPSVWFVGMNPVVRFFYSFSSFSPSFYFFFI